MTDLKNEKYDRHFPKQFNNKTIKLVKHDCCQFTEIFPHPARNIL